MAVLGILTSPDEILGKVSKPVEAFDERLHRLLDDMRETLIKAGGAGLAAVQVGYLMRVCVIWMGGKEYTEMINPEFKGIGNQRKGNEGCLSVPGVTVRMMRHREGVVSFQDRYGNWTELQLTNLQAVCVQHEIDHMQGVLIA